MNSDGDFPARLTAAMERAGRKSGAQLGREIGVAGSTVNDWKRGESEPTLSNLIAAAHRLDVSVQWLATGEGCMDASQEAAPQAEAAPEPALDKWLFSRVIDGIRRVYKRAGGQIPTVSEVELALDMHNRIAALAEGQEARHGALLMALDQLERDLHSSTDTAHNGETNGDKRSA